MKKEIPPAVIIGAVVVVVLLIGFVAFKTFFKDPNYTPDSAEDRKRMEQSRSSQMEAMQKARGIQTSGQAKGAYSTGGN